MWTREAGSGSDQSTPLAGKGEQSRSLVHVWLTIVSIARLYDATADANSADNVGLLMQ